MIGKNNKLGQVVGRFLSNGATQQLKLDCFPCEVEKKKQPRKNKEIAINRIGFVTKYDEMALAIEFELIPSKIEFSRLRSTLWFDDQEVKSELVRIPQGFGNSNAFCLKSELDMRGVSRGIHTFKVELHDLFSPCFGIREETTDYIPQDRKAAYRKIPMVKKIAGDNFVVSNSDKEIYLDIEKTRKKELASKQDKW